MTAEPIFDERSRTTHFFLEFTPEQEPLTVPLQTVAAPGTAPAEDLEFYRRHIADLEQELRLTRENLQTANEELQATNEELMAANEELKSTNEELHSVNEELFSVNSEFERENSELAGLNADHENLLSSVDTGVVFVDERLCIRKFNAAISGFFRLVPHDVGRPIEHIAYHLNGRTHILEEIRTVLTTGRDMELEDSTPSGSRHVLIRIMPFRSETGAIGGVVVMFTDITRIKDAEWTVRQLNEKLRCSYAVLGDKYQQEQLSGEQARTELRLREEDLLETQRIAGAALFTWDVQKDKVMVSDSFRQFVPDLAVAAPLDKESFLACFYPEDRDHLAHQMLREDDSTRRECALRIALPDGTTRHTHCFIRRRKTDEAATLVGIIHDVTERRQYELESLLVS